VLIKSDLNINVLPGSVATRLRCDGIFNDQFIKQSLLSSRVKKWKIVNICRSYGNLIPVRFYETPCTYSSFVLLAGNNDTLQLTLVPSQNSLSHCTTADQLI